MLELRKMTDEIFAVSVIALSTMRSYTGKLESLASLLFAMRPLVSPFWAALHADQGDAPTNCMWTSRVSDSLRWIRAFFHMQSPGPLVRMFTLEAYMNKGIRVRITCDASPWGIGGFLTIDGKIVAYFWDAISPEDQETLKVAAGDSRGQQCWECLAVLVAVKLWLPHWCTRRVRLAVRTDNMTTLAMARKLRAKGPGLTLLSQELALVVAQASYEPDVCEHTPVIQNGVADTLSRKYEPGKPWRLPELLQDAEAQLPPRRTSKWWKVLAPP